MDRRQLFGGGACDDSNIVWDPYIVINVRHAYEIFCAIEYLLQNIHI
jgi:hypothetical protein